MAEQNIDYDKILDEELLRIQIRKAIARATESIDYTELILENPYYKIVNGRPVWQAEE